jgi:hypothetical protein
MAAWSGERSRPQRGMSGHAVPYSSRQIRMAAAHAICGESDASTAARRCGCGRRYGNALRLVHVLPCLRGVMSKLVDADSLAAGNAEAQDPVLFVSTTRVCPCASGKC